MKFISSGSTVLDLALGKGYPIGKIINIVGDKSTGKTLLACEVIAKASKVLGKKLKWKYDDVERGLTFNTKAMYGIKIENKKDDQNSHTIEDFDHNFEKELNKIRDDEYLIYVLDSFDSLTCEAEIKRHEENRKLREKGKEVKGSYGLEKQVALGEFFRLKKKAIKHKNCLLIIISQVRQNIGVFYGEKYYRTGGKALDFYASQIIWLAEIEKHRRPKKNGRVVGITIKALMKKNKTGKPFRDCFIEILFDYGVDEIGTNARFLFDLKTDMGKDKDKKIDFEGSEYTIEEFVKCVELNNLEKDLELQVTEKWNAIEESITPIRKSKY